MLNFFARCFGRYPPSPPANEIIHIRSSLRHINIGVTNEQIEAGLLEMKKEWLDSNIDSELQILEFLYIKQVVAKGDSRRSYRF